MDFAKACMDGPGDATIIPIMENEPDKLQSWRQALEQGTLSTDQRAVLEDMVRQGQAESLEAAASMLDWQDAIINKPDHMYGF